MINKKVLSPILIVEDEEDHARLIMKSLRESEYVSNELVLLENGEDAINFLYKKDKYCDDEHRLPVLILLDVKMPMKNGFEVLEEMKKDPDLKKIPVVMLSTSSTTEDMDKAFSLGANDYIVKPVRFSEFTSKVQKVGYYWGIVSDSGMNII